jgi:hypothetical protein
MQAEEFYQVGIIRKSKMKKVLIALGIFILLGFSFWMYMIFSKVPDLKPNITVRKVYSSSLNDTIFLRREGRGLNYEVTAITSSSSEKYEPTSEVDYIYSSTGTSIFYTVKEDTLFVYTYTLAKIPARIQSKFKIKQIEMSRSEIDELQNSFKKKGLEML